MQDTDVTGQNTRQELALTRVYSGYRLALAVLLPALYWGVTGQRLVGSHHGGLFLATALAYLVATALIGAQLARRPQPLPPWQLTGHLLLDLLALLLMAHASGGVQSGLPLLLVVSVATGAILLHRRLALLIAALASLGLLASTLQLLSAGHLDNDHLLTTGLLGTLCFAAALVMRRLADRIGSAQQLAMAHAADARRLLELNQHIVRRMRTGVVVLDATDSLRLINQSARELLHVQGEAAEVIPRLLGPGLERWRQQPGWQPGPFRSHEAGPELLLRYTSLAEQQDGDTLVFVEDFGQFNQRAQQLKLASLGRLTASIAHEIRNPLGAVSHAAQLLQESPALAPEEMRLAAIIQRHSRRMDGIIESVLQLSRRQPPAMRPLQLDHWLAEVCADFRQSHPEAQLRLVGDPDCFVRADPDQLQQVLTNLLDNAVRHSAQATGRPGARLQIRRDRLTGLWALEVSNEGPGIAEADVERIFEPFYTTENKGSGLGLYLARELCEINQARLNYLRRPEGCTFRISFAHVDRAPLVDSRIQEEA